MGNVVALDKARKQAAPPKDPDGRPLPHNAKVEAALLFGLMSPDLATPELATTLRLLIPDHLFNPANQRVLAAMKDIAAEGTTIEPVTVFAKLQHVPAPVGGWDRYLNETIPAEGGNAEARPSEYAKILLDRWRAREVMRVCARVVERGFDGVDSAALIEEAKGGVAVVGDTQIEASAGAACDALAEAWRNITNREPKHRGLSWGWPSVDRGGGRTAPARMAGAGAGRGVGKASLAGRGWEAVAVAPEDDVGIGEAVYFVSGELKVPELVGRQTGIRAGVPPEAIEGDRPLTQDEIGRLLEAQENLRGMPIIVDDNGGRPFTVADIEARVRSAQARFAAGTYATPLARYAKNRLRLVVVDYLTKLKPPVLAFGQRYDSREREVAAISGALMELAKVLDVHVLVIAAVSRGGEKSKGTDPRKRELQMSDLRESGMIEYDAASIIFANAPEDGVLRLKNAKQRFRVGAGPVDLAMVRGRIFEPEGAS